MEPIRIEPIGVVRRDGKSIQINLEKQFAPGLTGLEHFTHVIVLWWAHGMDEEKYRKMLQTNPPYAPEHLTGVFATRAPYRPNPIAVTVCPIRKVDGETGVVEVTDIDAVDGTPVLDLKAYFPVCDRVRVASIPDWLSDWPEWMPDEGIGLQEYEES